MTRHEKEQNGKETKEKRKPVVRRINAREMRKTSGIRWIPEP